MQERFHTSPGGFDSTYVEAGDGENKGRASVKQVRGGSPGGALIWFPRRITGKE